MADRKKVDKSLEGEPPADDVDTNIAVTTSEVCSVAGSSRTSKVNLLQNIKLVLALYISSLES